MQKLGSITQKLIYISNKKKVINKYFNMFVFTNFLFSFIFLLVPKTKSSSTLREFAEKTKRK